jgi:GT2 family glycosyltransferase
MNAISVVLGTYNRRESVQRAVESILRETERPVTVFVTDAGSTDGTVEYLESVRSEQLVPILRGEKLGQARAYNEVFSQVTTPYVCWLSDDNEVVNHGLDEAAAVLDERPDIGMVALKVRDMQGPFVEAPYIGGVSAIGVLNVNQGMLRTSLMSQLGGFSEEFRDYGIDPDLTVRTLLAGFAIAHTRKVAIQHYRDWGPGRHSEQFRAQWARQEKYLQLYRAKYGHLAKGDAGWWFKRSLWAAVRLLLPDRWLNSSSALLAGCPRDWQNAFCGRYISVLDPLLYRNERYHLVQRPPNMHV